MPRTRAVAKSQVVPEKSEVDLERKERLRAYLQDFDDKVEAQIKAMHDYADKLCADINNTCNFELLKIPKNIRKMTMAEFLAKGGKLDSNRVVTFPLEERIPSRPNRVSKAAKRTIGKKSAKKHKRSNSADALRKQTAQNRELRSSSVSEVDKRKTTNVSTPFTPKFDPRLPITPATGLRRVKMGEPVVMMSLQGSPLTATDNDVAIAMPLEEGKMTFINSQMSVDSTDNDMKKKLQLIQEKLRSVVQTKSSKES